jgi:hypothetical protein
MNANSAKSSEETVPPAIWLGVRFLASSILFSAYFRFRKEAGAWLEVSLESWAGHSSPATARVLLVSLLILGLLITWWRYVASDARWHAPVLITVILAIGDAAYGILEMHHSNWLASLTAGRVDQYNPTLLAIVVTILVELVFGLFYWGKWPHLASAYISGISAGVLIRSPELWPFILGPMLSIVSKYAIRIGNRHIFNPTNFGLTVILFLAPQSVATLTVQAGNEVWSVLVIWILGAMIMYRLKRFHIPLAFVAAFAPLAVFRAMVNYPDNWQRYVGAELAPMTWTMFQLYIFFMITDPKTTTRARWSQTLVAMLVAIMDTVLRLTVRDVHSLYHALFIVGPIANLIEIYYDARQKTMKASAVASPALQLASGGR